MKKRFWSMLLAVAAALSLLATASAAEPLYAPTYWITVKNTYGGTVSVSHETAMKGELVTVTVTPDAGFRTTGIVVRDRSAIAVPVQNAGRGTFTFVQPESHVYLEAAFEADTWVCPYGDITPSYWAYDSIRTVSIHGIMGGTSTTVFNPAGTVTRQQSWMVLARLSGLDPANMNEARAWAVSSGVSDGSNPTNTVSRQQLATLLYRYACNSGDPTVANVTTPLSHPDAASVAAYALPAMRWAVSRDMIDCTDAGLLDPAGAASRIQMARMLAVYLEG